MIITQLTEKYKHTKRFFDLENTYILATQKEFKEDFEPEDFNLLKIRGAFPTKELENIHFLEVTYSKGKSWKILEQYLEHMTALHTLYLPTIYMKDIHMLKFPNSLKCLRFINQSEFNAYFRENKDIFQSEKLLKNLKLESLTYLGFFHSSYCNCVEEYIEISPKQFPNLEYVDFRNDNQSTLLEQLRIFPSIKHLRIDAISIPIFEHLSPLGSRLQTLTLVGLGESFSFEGIGELKSLQAIWVNSTFCHTDCSVFLEVPQIEEITLINGQFVINVEAILELPNLKSLKLLDCKTPNKKNLITKEIKKKFLDKGFKSVG